MAKHVLYECEICNCYHPWFFSGDCRDDKNRFEALEAYAEHKKVSIYKVEVRSMEDRVSADMRGE